MTIKSYFFNARQQPNGTFDRCYNAEDVTSYLDLLVGNGVFPNPSTQLQVNAAGSGMKVSVQPGQGWINGHKMISTSVVNLNIDKSDIVLDRIDRVIFFVDHDTRAMSIEVKKGTPSASPTPPALVRNETRYEMCLAEVTVPKQTTTITAANIRDTRGYSTICGWVYGLIDQIDTTTVFESYQAGFDAFMEQIKGDLLSEILMRKYSAFVSTTGNSYRTIPVRSLISNYDPEFDIVEIRVNGLCVPAGAYTVNVNAGTVILNEPITHSGTDIEVVVYKNSEVEGSNFVRKLSALITTDDNPLNELDLYLWIDGGFRFATDILEIRVSGLVLPSNAYSVSNAGVVTLNEPITHAGTDVEIVVYRNVVQAGHDGGSEEDASIVDLLGSEMYVATGEFDNQHLSARVKSFLCGGSDYKQLTLNVHGELAASEPAKFVDDFSYWFDFCDGGNTTRRIIIDFANCDRIVIDAERVDNTRFMLTCPNVEVRNLQCVLTNCDGAQVIEGDGVFSSCVFWATSANDSTGALVGANSGKFNDCRMSVSAAGGKAYGFSLPNDETLRLSGCEVVAYNESSGVESVGVHVRANSTNSTLVMMNCELPIVQRDGLKQDNVVKINGGHFSLVANVFGKNPSLYATGENKSSYGNIVVS